MNDKERAELFLGQQFVEVYNKTHGTNYSATKALAEADSADVYLVSDQKLPRVGLQIRRVTTTERMHEEGIQGSLERKISRTLAQDAKNCLVMIHSQRAPGKNDVEPWHHEVIELINKNFEIPDERIEITDDGEGPPFKAPISSITIRKNAFRDPSICDAHFVVVKNVLDPQESIQLAINEKTGKNYVDSSLLWLLLYPDAGAFPFSVEIIKQMVSDLKNMGKFAQIWWFYPRSNNPEIYQFR